MGQGVLATLLAWVGAHPFAALTLVFAVALGESLFLFGLLIPGALFMFAFGALIGANALPLTATFVAAIAGTLLGDTLSYLLGRRYRGRIGALPGFKRAPALVARSEAFLARHGGKGIVLGRLIGAIRPVMPTVAGAAGLSPRRFALMETLATAIWAPCYILPGVVFGASLDLAAQVATRLAILLLAVAAILWASTLAARAAIAAGRVAARRHAEQLLDWSRRHRRLGLLGPALADPRQPELPALAVAASLLMLAIGALYTLAWGWHRPAFPWHLDALTYYLIRGLRNPIADAPARVIAELGSPLIYLPFAGVIGALLLGLGNWRAAAHWAAALGFSALATLLLRWWLAVPAPIAYFHGAGMDPLYLAGGGQDLILCATVYGLFGVILASRARAPVRPYYYSVTVAGVMLIALSRLYLGLDWASDLLIGLPVAFIWLHMLTLCYRRQRPRHVPDRPVLGALAICVVVAATVALWPDHSTRALAHPFRATPVRSVDDWAQGGYTRLPRRITDMVGRASAPLNVQAAGTASALRDALARAGWQPAPRFTLGQLLRWLVSDADIHTLSVLPRVHDGRPAAITRVIDAPHDGRWVVRLWPTAAVTRQRNVALWVGLVDYQHVSRRFHLLGTAVDQGRHAAAVDALRASLAGAGVGYRRLDGDDPPQLLFWSTPVELDAKVAPD